MIPVARRSRHHWIRIIIGLLLVGATITAVASRNLCTWRTPEQTGRVSVLSYNILAAAPPSAETLHVIRQARADVICLQEVAPSVHRYMRRHLGDTYPHALYRNAVGGYGGLAFYSKYGLRDVEYMPKTGGGWFPAWIVHAQTPAGTIQILQVHLRPRVADIGGRIVGHFTVGWTHRREIEHFCSSLDPNMPTVIVGDFNEGDSGPAIEFLERSGFNNALPQFGATGETWRGSLYGVHLGARIDHVLVPPHFACASARVLQRGGSDHRAVCVSLKRLEGDQP